MKKKRRYYTIHSCEIIHEKKIKGSDMQQLPEPSRKRLVQMARVLEQHNGQPKTIHITSEQLSVLTGWTQHTIRRDISHLGIRCGASNGYPVQRLLSAIYEILGITAESRYQHTCCIVGLGSLGQALLSPDTLKNSPFKLTAGFDKNVNRTETLKAPFPLYPQSKMCTVITQEHIEYAILAVSDTDAWETARLLSACGIKGIVNYTATVLPPGEHTLIENVSPITALTNMLR